MANDLIALDLAHSSRSRPRPGALLDALLALVRDLLAVDEETRRAALSQRIDAFRAALADGATADDLTELSTSCIADAQQVVKELQAQQAERAREMASLV